MAKILFLKFPKELKGEMIGLTGKRIPSLSSILELTGEAIKRLQVKIGTSAYSSSDTGRISSQGVARRPKNTSSFHIGAGPQTLPGYSRSWPPILFVTFFKGKKSFAVNCLLDTGSGRSYPVCWGAAWLGLNRGQLAWIARLDYPPCLASVIKRSRRWLWESIWVVETQLHLTF